MSKLGADNYMYEKEENFLKKASLPNLLKFNFGNLRDLSPYKKILFIKLFLIKDEEEFKKLCNDENLLHPSLVSDIWKFSDKLKIYTALNFWIRFLFPNQLDYSQILQDIFTGVPDNIISEKNKMVFLKKNFPNAIDDITTISYNESPIPLSFQKLTTKINISEYKNALKTQCDYSEFIILTLGLLQSISKNSIYKVQFHRIEKNYFDLKYEECLSDLIKIAKQLKDTREIDENTFQLILSERKRCTEIVKEKNHSRRFYEVKLAQYAIGQYEHTEKLESFNRLFNFFNMGNLFTASEVEARLGFIINKFEKPEFQKRELYFKNLSKKYQTKDKNLRSGFLPKDPTLGKAQKKSAYSMNLGGIKANTPNFRDCIAKAPIRNRIPDIMQTPNTKEGYSSVGKRNRSAYVASLSGHAFLLIAMCESYAVAQTKKYKQMAPNTRSEMLSKDINNILSAYASWYVVKGYHSFFEMLDVFREPTIKDYFKKHFQVELNPKIEDSIKTFAINDTLAYTKALALKNALHKELSSKFADKAKIQKMSLKLEVYNNLPIYEKKREAARQQREESRKQQMEAVRNRAFAKIQKQEVVKKQREAVARKHL